MWFIPIFFRREEDKIYLGDIGCNGWTFACIWGILMCLLPRTTITCTYTGFGLYAISMPLIESIKSLKKKEYDYARTYMLFSLFFIVLIGTGVIKLDLINYIGGWVLDEYRN